MWLSPQGRSLLSAAPPPMLLLSPLAATLRANRMGLKAGEEKTVVLPVVGIADNRRMTGQDTKELSGPPVGCKRAGHTSLPPHARPRNRKIHPGESLGLGGVGMMSGRRHALNPPAVMMAAHTAREHMLTGLPHASVARMCSLTGMIRENHSLHAHCLENSCLGPVTCSGLGTVFDMRSSRE